MQYKWSIIVIGLIVALLPFLGFPGAVRDWFVAIGGLSIAAIVFFANEISLIRWKGKKADTRPDSYVENEKTSFDDRSSSSPKV
ncbi:MAG: hypothetical protein HZC03_02615 [Candidatus Lloydbacteria bacterium]|nr:hypothetical protein [Candidatus Lloydbacteria bacterium]